MSVGVIQGPDQGMPSQGERKGTGMNRLGDVKARRRIP